MKKLISFFQNIKSGKNNNDSIPLNESVVFSKNVLDDFRKTVGKFPAETGGMLACSKDIKNIDTWCFDKKSENTSVSYNYDVESMTEIYRTWKEQNIKSVGFVHSHPSNYRKPSYDDIATGYILMKFFKNEFFYLPIIISNREGLFRLYNFVLRKEGNNINVNLDYILSACENGYEYTTEKKWNHNYSIHDLESYYNQAYMQCEAPKEETSKGYIVDTKSVENAISNDDYFQRLKGVYPDNVLNKVIICVGVGGARTIIENFARNGFRNFILIDGDKVAPSNIATQGVFISEMGMYKTEAIRQRVLDINPNANVVCLNKFLDDNMSDNEFKGYLDYFHRSKPTDYLILGCTDSFRANNRASILSLKYGIPYIGATVYKQGLAAEVIFVYPGLTESCPRCLLRNRYEAYEKGYVNDVTSAGCPTFATERLNTLIGYISLMILMYNAAPDSPYNKMLEEVKDRNFVWIRMSPYLSSSELKIKLFDKVFASPEVSKYTFMDETLWLPQTPDSTRNGVDDCKLCGGIGDLRTLFNKWSDTRIV